MTTENPPQGISAEDVERMISEQLAARDAQHKAELDSVRAELEAMRAAATAAVVTQVPEHSAGVGNTVHDTWSQYEQELASAGVHPLQLAAAEPAEEAAA